MKKNKIKVLFFLFFSFLLISCSENKDIKIKIKENKIEEIKNSPLAKMSVENILNDFIINSEKHKIKLGKFDRLSVENKSFYHAQIESKDKASYTVNFEGIDIEGLYMKTEMINGTDLATIEEMAINLIEISDNEIKYDEAREIYNEILATIKENELSNKIKYKNGISYGIQIEQDTGELIFFAQ